MGGSVMELRVLLGKGLLWGKDRWHWWRESWNVRCIWWYVLPSNLKWYQFLWFS